jgi:hypothetical protein
MPYKDEKIKIKTGGEKGTIFEDNYKKQSNDKVKNRYGNSYINGHLKSNISFTPDVIKKILYIKNRNKKNIKLLSIIN